MSRDLTNEINLQACKEQNWTGQISMFEPSYVEINIFTKIKILKNHIQQNLTSP